MVGDLVSIYYPCSQHPCWGTSILASAHLPVKVPQSIISAWCSAEARACVQASALLKHSYPQDILPQCLFLTSWPPLPCNRLYCMLYMQLLGARAWKAPVLALLAINTAIAMKQTDGFLSTKLVDPTYAAFPGRMDTTIAGACLEPTLFLAMAGPSQLQMCMQSHAHAALSCIFLEELGVPGNAHMQIPEEHGLEFSIHFCANSSMLAAGFGLVSIFNVFLILVLGVADEESKAAAREPMRSAYSGSMNAPLA